jgi:hypothetical protein
MKNGMKMKKRTFDDLVEIKYEKSDNEDVLDMVSSC